jgi:hypothetical protein
MDKAFRDDGNFSDSEDSFASNDEAMKTGKDGGKIRVQTVQSCDSVFARQNLRYLREKCDQRGLINICVIIGMLIRCAFLLGILSRIGSMPDALGCSSGHTR